MCIKRPTTRPRCEADTEECTTCQAQVNRWNAARAAQINQGLADFPASNFVPHDSECPHATSSEERTNALRECSACQKKSHEEWLGRVREGEAGPDAKANK